MGGIVSSRVSDKEVVDEFGSSAYWGITRKKGKGKKGQAAGSSFSFRGSAQSFKLLGLTAAKKASDLWMIDPDTVAARVADARRAAPNSSARTRALHSLYHTTFKNSNRLLMLNMGVVDLMAEELLVSGSNTRALLLVVGCLRNLSICEESKLPMMQMGIHEPLIALSWLADGDMTIKAMGTIMNLANNAHVGVNLVKAGVVKLVLHKLRNSVDDDVQIAAALILFNITTNKRTTKDEFRKEAIDVLKGLLIKKNLLGLTVTLTTMLLIGDDRDHPLIIFTDRQTNVSQMIRCFKLAIEGKPMYGIVWFPDNVLFALSTAALYEPSRKKMAKLGLYDRLSNAIDKRTRVQLADPFTEDVAIELRALLRPILVQMGLMADASNPWDRKGQMATVSLTGSSLAMFSVAPQDGDSSVSPRKKSIMKTTVRSGRRRSSVVSEEEDNASSQDIRKGVMPF